MSSLLDLEKKKPVFNLINRIHKRSLRTVYNDTSSTFQELLLRNRSVSIYHKNI